MKSSSGFRLGTRGSALALWQAGFTKHAVEAAHTDLQVQIVEIKTTGDRIQDVPLAQVGGKGLFTKELDEALLDHRIDAAVHSLKDLPFSIPDGLILAAVGRREDPRDALVSAGARLEELAGGARIGTSSLRRQAQLRHAFPSLVPGTLRGNVDTRIRKLDAGEFDGIILAAAGLKRLGHAGRITEYLDPDWMIPAVGQGALAYVCRAGDSETRRRLDAIDDAETGLAVTAERAFLAGVEGNCQIPIAGYAMVSGGRLSISGMIAAIDGSRVLRDRVTGPGRDAAALGSELATRVLESGGRTILDAIRKQ